MVNRVPGAEKAVIPDNKIVRFLLDPEKKHYKEFVAVGYSKKDPDRLKRDLLEGLVTNTAQAYEANEHGASAFHVDMFLGVTRKARFRTAWQIDKDKDYPRFITAHRIGVNRK